MASKFHYLIGCFGVIIYLKYYNGNICRLILNHNVKGENNELFSIHSRNFNSS